LTITANGVPLIRNAVYLTVPGNDTIDVILWFTAPSTLDATATMDLTFTVTAVCWEDVVSTNYAYNISTVFRINIVQSSTLSLLLGYISFAFTTIFRMLTAPTISFSIAHILVAMGIAFIAHMYTRSYSSSKDDWPAKCQDV